MAKVDKRAEKQVGEKNGRFKKKLRVESTPSLLPPPQNAPGWAIAHDPDDQDDQPINTITNATVTPQATGLGGNARHNIGKHFSTENILEKQV